MTACSGFPEPLSKLDSVSLPSREPSDSAVTFLDGGDLNSNEGTIGVLNCGEGYGQRAMCREKVQQVLGESIQVLSGRRRYRNDRSEDRLDAAVERNGPFLPSKLEFPTVADIPSRNFYRMVVITATDG